MQCTQPLNNASLGPLSPNPKRHLDRLSPFCTAHGRESIYFTIGRPFPLKIATFHGVSEPPCNTWFLGSIQAHNPNGISIGTAVFAQLTAEFPFTMGRSSLSKLPIPMGDLDSGPPSNMIP